MKNWADHCSSDEESLDDLVDEVAAQKLAEVDASGPPPAEVAVDDRAAEPLGGDDVAPAAPVQRVYEFPDQPPFSAFIGNLAYSVKEAEELKEAVMKCAQDLLGEEIHILGARIAFGRDGQHRGFGYLELETLDQLKLLMQLNDTEGTIAGRKIQLDTANGNKNNRRTSNQRRPHAHGDNNKLDGFRFRGGRYNDSNNNRTNSGSEDGGGPPRQRPGLKLAPRTKKLDDDDKNNNNNRPASSDIFGGAKARDAKAWEQRRKSEKQDNGNNSNNNSASTGTSTSTSNNNNHRKGDQDRRRSTPGGRGRGGRGGDRFGSGGVKAETNVVGGSSNGKRGPRRQAQQPNQQSPEERAAAAAAKAATTTPAAAAEPPKTKAPPANKFALLMDSDSE